MIYAAPPSVTVQVRGRINRFAATGAILKRKTREHAPEFHGTCEPAASIRGTAGSQARCSTATATGRRLTQGEIRCTGRGDLPFGGKLSWM
jgi:hypothetical protein